MSKIKPKQKPCKNCKTMDYLHHGMCKICYCNWLIGTPKGKAKLNKSILKVRKTTEKKAKAKLKERKVSIMPNDSYRSKIVQPIINEIARLIDYGQPCIATGLNTGKQNGGHYYSTGSNRTLCLNLHNIHLQSYHSNCENGGDNLRYRNGLRNIYGQEYLDFVENLKSIPAIKLSKTDLIEIANKARKIRKELKADTFTRSAPERIKLRNKINKELGIFENSFENL